MPVFLWIVERRKIHFSESWIFECHLFYNGKTYLWVILNTHKPSQTVLYIQPNHTNQPYQLSIFYLYLNIEFEFLYNCFLLFFLDQQATSIKRDVVLHGS